MEKKGRFSYVGYSLIVIIAWGLVPGLAKKSSLSGGLTTMWVNWFALVGVALMMLVNGSARELKRPQPYSRLLLIGLVWPLVYSVAYFSSVSLGSSSMTTITNYCWPVFYLGLAFLFWRERFARESWLVVGLAVLAVAIPLALEEGLRLDLWPVFLGLIAASSQALFLLLTRKDTQNAWLVTLVIEAVTVVGSTLFVLVFERFSVPNLESLIYLAFIGFISNGIGFWAFLRGGQESERAGKKAKISFLMMMCTIPLIQVLALPFLRVEPLESTRWVGVFLITLALMTHRYLGKE